MSINSSEIVDIAKENAQLKAQLAQKDIEIAQNIIEISLTSLMCGIIPPS